MRTFTLSFTAFVMLSLASGCVIRGAIPVGYTGSTYVSGGGSYAVTAPVATSATAASNAGVSTSMSVGTAQAGLSTTVVSSSTGASAGMTVNTPNGPIGMNIGASQTGASIGMVTPRASVSMTAGQNGASVGVDARPAGGPGLGAGVAVEAE
ncbi:MAG: hypothetical protein U0326_33425 [Polyangiales bacterium]